MHGPSVPSTLVYPIPPPTRNILDTQQRIRLIRSTRKLGAVLGTTPHLVEAFEPFGPTKPIPITFLPIGSKSRPRSPSKTYAKDGRRKGSIFEFTPGTPESLYASSSTNSSVVSLVLPPPRSSVDVLPTPKSFSSNPRRSADAQRPLVLKLNPVAIPPSYPRIPLSPISPNSTSSPSSATPRAFTFPQSVSEDLESPSTPTTPTPAELRRKKMAKLTRTLGENIPPELVFKSQRRPSPATTPRTPTAPYTSSETTSIRRKHHAPSASAPHVGLSQTMTSGLQGVRRSSRVWVTGTSAWTGEWNRRDIREVQKSLRELKRR